MCSALARPVETLLSQVERMRDVRHEQNAVTIGCEPDPGLHDIDGQLRPIHGFAKLHLVVITTLDLSIP
jgi:hypothetical protein